MGNFRGGKFLRLSLNDSFHELNFEDLATRLLLHYTLQQDFEELIFEAAAKSAKKQNLLSSKISRYAVFTFAHAMQIIIIEFMQGCG